MGIFKSIFSSKKNRNIDSLNFNARSEYKDSTFFINSLKEENNIIEMLKEENNKLSEDNKLEPFHLWSIAMKFLRKVYLKFSLGEKVSTIKEDYLNALDYYIKGWDKEDATYSDMIDMVSLAILFEVSNNEIEGLIDYVNKTEKNTNLDNWKPDYLLGYLLNYRNSAKVIPDSILIPSLYQEIINVTKLNKEEAQSKMKDYLEKWYSLHKNDPWYECHKRQWGYSGYWSWESAAVVKVMGLDDSSFKNHPHYPYDMVHWQDDIQE